MTVTAQMLTVHIPLTIQRRGGRKVISVLAHDETNRTRPPRRRADPALVKALARAHRWNSMLESGRYASISELATAERIDRGYCGRILQLTLLAPDIIEAILDGRQSATVGLPRLLKPFPIDWEEQRRRLIESDET